MSDLYMRYYVNINMGGNNITNQSDERLKDNIQLIPDEALKKIMNIPIVSFDWLNGGGHVDAGVIAQAIQKDFPNCVTEDNGIYSVIPVNLIYWLIKAVQELNDKVDGSQTIQGLVDQYSKEEKMKFIKEHEAFLNGKRGDSHGN